MLNADHLMSHQIELEKLYNKNQTIGRIRDYFENQFPDDLGWFFDINEIPRSFGFSLLTQMALHKRCQIHTMVSILRQHFPTAQEVADMILKCCEVDLLHWHPVRYQLVVEFCIPQDIQDEIDRFQFPLPMVVEPRKVKSNKDTGYVSSRGSIILKKNHHDEDVCLDHINRMNRVKFRIDTDTASMVRNRWKNLDKPKDGESKEDFEKRVRAFEKFDRTCHDVIDVLTEHGNEFFLTHKYDKRGRVYCQGYHVNYQGAPWNKATIELAEPELVE